jgi:transposase
LRKYTEKTKIAAAADYCSGQLGLKIVAKRHGVGVSSLRKWISTYLIHGSEGLRRRRRHYHSVESRLLILNRMRDEGLSYRKAAALFNIENFNILKKWEQEHQVGICSARALYASASREKMKKKKSSESHQPDETRNLQELLREINHLRMENAYLKKLNALAQVSKQAAQGNGRRPCKS